jgi:hypothetical protein
VIWNLLDALQIRVMAPRYTSDVNPLIFPEHDSQFKHTSEIYDLYLEVKNSARQRIEVDMESKLVDKMLRTGTVEAAMKMVGGTSKLRPAAEGVQMASFGVADPGPSSLVGDTSQQVAVDDPSELGVEDKKGKAEIIQNIT